MVSKYFFMFLAIMILGAPAWLLVPYQVAEVSSEYSVGLRFLIASLAIECFRRFREDNSPKVSISLYGLIFVQGACLYAINFWLCYESSKYMASGLIAVAVSTMIIPNMILGKIFLHKEISWNGFLGAIIGLAGVGFLFKDDISTFDFESTKILGLGLAFLSTFFSVTGTIVSGKILKSTPSVLFVTSRAMGFGALLSLIYNGFVYQDMHIALTFEFLGSLFYLSLVVTTLVYVLYSNLIKDVGPGNASFLWIVMPGICLLMSYIFENYSWTTYSSIGIFSIVFGGSISTYGQQIVDLFKKREYDANIKKTTRTTVV